MMTLVRTVIEQVVRARDGVGSITPRKQQRNTPRATPRSPRYGPKRASPSSSQHKASRCVAGSRMRADRADAEPAAQRSAPVAGRGDRPAGGSLLEQARRAARRPTASMNARSPLWCDCMGQPASRPSGIRAARRTSRRRRHDGAQHQPARSRARGDRRRSRPAGGPAARPDGAPRTLTVTFAPRRSRARTFPAQQAAPQPRNLPAKPPVVSVPSCGTPATTRQALDAEHATSLHPFCCTILRAPLAHPHERGRDVGAFPRSSRRTRSDAAISTREDGSTGPTAGPSNSTNSNAVNDLAGTEPFRSNQTRPSKRHDSGRSADGYLQERPLPAASGNNDDHSTTPSPLAAALPFAGLRVQWTPLSLIDDAAAPPLNLRRAGREVDRQSHLHARSRSARVRSLVGRAWPAPYGRRSTPPEAHAHGVPQPIRFMGWIGGHADWRPRPRPRGCASWKRTGVASAPSHRCGPGGIYSAQCSRWTVTRSADAT